MYNNLIGSKVNVYYDPFDLSRVLVTNEKDIRFIARTAQLQPRALKDQYTGSRTYLNAILAEKKDQVGQVSSASAKRKETVNIDYYNAEAMLQGGVMIKELKNEAEQRFLETGGRRSLEDMIGDM
jgi:Mu transposase, C-terminal